MTLQIAQLVDESTFPPPAASGELALDLTGHRIAGARVVLEWVARSWLTPRGALPHAAGEGDDLRVLENSTLDAQDLQRWRSRLAGRAKSVDYVLACAVVITREGRAIVIQGSVRLVDGRTYPLEVRIADAAAVVSFGGGA